MSSPLAWLHRYFVAAARIQHHFESNLVSFEELQPGTDAKRPALELFAGPRGNFKYYWYGSLYVVIEGYQTLKLHDPTLDMLLRSSNKEVLRRCWTAAFHFRPELFSEEPAQGPDFVRWVRELMSAFRSYFERELEKPVATGPHLRQGEE